MENTQIVKPMNIVERFALVFTKEPYKSLRKANILDGNDLITPEGARILMTWLVTQKFAEEFKKDVVDKMLEDDKKSK